MIQLLSDIMLALCRHMPYYAMSRRRLDDEMMPRCSPCHADYADFHIFIMLPPLFAITLLRRRC